MDKNRPVEDRYQITKDDVGCAFALNLLKPYIEENKNSIYRVDIVYWEKRKVRGKMSGLNTFEKDLNDLIKSLSTTKVKIMLYDKNLSALDKYFSFILKTQISAKTNIDVRNDTNADNIIDRLRLG